MTTNDPSNQAFVSEVIQSLACTIALTARVHQREVSRRIEFALASVKKQLLQRDGDFLRKPDANEATGCDGVSWANQSDGLLCANDFATRDAVRCRRERMLEACTHDVSGLHPGVVLRRYAVVGTFFNSTTTYIR
jgi:hypothetical protein